MRTGSPVDLGICAKKVSNDLVSKKFCLSILVNQIKNMYLLYLISLFKHTQTYSYNEKQTLSLSSA